MPGAEVLGGELAICYLTQIIVDIRRGHVAPAAARPEGEQALAAAPAPLERTHHRVHVAVDDRLFPLLGPLGWVVEDELAAPDAHVLAADGGDAEGAVLRRVLLPAGPEEAEIDQPDGGGEHPVPAQSLSGEMTADHLPQTWQDRAELQHAGMLVAVPLNPPQVVIAVLAAPGRVGADRLDV